MSQINTVGGALGQYIAGRADGDELLAHLTSNIDPGESFRLIMMQILLSRVLPASTVARKDVLQELFSPKVVEDAETVSEPPELPPKRSNVEEDVHSDK
jgi:hypothetical protein